MGTNTQIENPVIFFDGVCNLCNASVNFIIKRDKKKLFRFSSLQSDFASKALPESLTKEAELQSLVLLKDGILVKSTAALTIARELSGLWPILYVFIVIPRFIRHFIYDLIAKNRYNWFGKKDQCMIPTPELKERFVD